MFAVLRRSSSIDESIVNVLTCRLLETCFISQQGNGRLGRRFWRRRAVLLAAIIVALSLGIVVASIPYIPRPHGSLQAPETHDIRGGTETYPGVFALTLQGISAGASFVIGVTVTNGSATFCVIDQFAYLTWAFNNQTMAYPYSSCILRQDTSQDTLTCSTPTTRNWNVVAINTSPSGITVRFYPA